MPTKVTDPAILAQLNGGTPTSPAAPFPGVIPGRPKQPAEPTPKNPYDVETDQRDYNRQVEQDRLKRVDTYRTEFLGLPPVKQFQDVRNATQQIVTLAQGEGSAMGDLGLIFSYMKALDPGSTVREGEAATAQNAAGVPEQVRNYYNRLMSGERLSPEQRQDMAQTAISIYKTRAQSYNDLANIYRGLIGEVGGDADKNGISLAPDLAFNPASSQAPEESSGEKRDDPFPGIIGEDGKPLPPEGGYGFDPKTGEWSLYGRVTDDSPTPYDPGGALDPNRRITGNDPAYAQFAAGVGDIVEGGINNTVGLIANPVNTLLFRGLGYDGFTSNLGQTAREGLGLPYGNETIGAINQAVTGGLSGAAGARALANPLSQGIARNALAEYGNRPVLDAVTGGSAALSGEVARQAGAGPVGQAAAIVAGGATPTAITGLSRNALLQMRPGSPRPPSDFDPSVVQAGERQGIPIRLPDAVPSARGDTAALETSQRGGPIIQQARANDNALIEQRVEQLGGEGAALDPYPLGQRVQGAGNRYIERTRGEKNQLYTRAEQLADGRRINPQQAIAAVDRNIAELEASGANTNAAVIGYLRELRGDLAKSDGFSITEFQALRSAANKKIRGDNALTVSDADRRLSDVVQAFSADASEQLPEAASAALEQADQFYSQRQDFINGVLRNVMGTRGNPLPAERAAERLVAMTRGKGDYERFSRMWGELAPDEKADVATTIAMSLGRKANGEFSPATLIRSLDPRSGLNPRTARLIFGREGAQALSDLRAIAQAKTATASALNNSRTGTVVNRVGGGLKTLLWGAMGLQAGGVGGAVAAPVARDLLAKWGEERAARALMNPDFTKWLRNAPEATNPKAIDAYFKRLEVQAAKSPILAQDVRGLQEALAEAFSQSPRQAAAASQQEND